MLYLMDVFFFMILEFLVFLKVFWKWELNFVELEWKNDFFMIFIIYNERKDRLVGGYVYFYFKDINFRN